MIRIKAITSQIEIIADHALGSDGYSVESLREISQALCRASARLEAEIMQRVADPHFKGGAQ
jgi:hypothetical protein